MNKLSRTASKCCFELKKHSPEILVTAGVIGVVTSTVMACKATTKVNRVLDDAKKELDNIHTCMDQGYIPVPADGEIKKVEYTPEEGKKDLNIVYTQTGLKVVKLYAPAVMLGTAAILSIVKSHNILRKRNVAIAAAYATVDKSFKEYRKRVAERFGDAVEKEIKYNLQSKEIEEKVIDEKGKEQTVTKTVTVLGPNDYSEFSKIFDKLNPNWENTPEYNMLFLKAQQNYANDLLRAKGFLFLNDVYEMLGFPRTIAGQSVGWLYDPRNCDHKGDNYVDFGILDVRKQSSCDFVNGYESAVILDFNVDGNILVALKGKGILESV